MKAASLLLMAIAWPALSYGIGRSGNGAIKDANLGFGASVPILFSQTQTTVNDGLRLFGPVIGSTSRAGLTHPVLDFRVFAPEFPQFASLDRKGVTSALIASHYERVATSSECLDVYEQNTGSAFTAIALWGNGKGIVVNGTSDGIAVNGVQEAISTLTLDPGACTWK